MTMRLLITGNMGYVGPVLIKYLRHHHSDLHISGLDTGYFAACITTTEALPECRIDMQYFSDIRHFPASILRGHDAMVHLAAISNDPMGNTFKHVTEEVNYQASVRAAAMAKSAGIGSFVFASSCSIYGSAENAPRTETADVNPLTEYARSKVRTEEELKQLAGPDFTVTSLRFATACGMSDRLRLDLVLNDFVAAAVTSKKIVIFSDGSPWRPLINVQDMARAIDWAVHRRGENGGRYLAVNAGSDAWNYQVRDLAEAVADIVGGTQIVVNENAQPDKRSYKVDFSLFRQLAPGHQPQKDLHGTIEALQQGLRLIDFKDSGFHHSDLIRLETLRRLKACGLLNDRLEWADRVIPATPLVNKET
jgi:nucleoside-diphosphate-sugar epimerase